MILTINANVEYYLRVPADQRHSMHRYELTEEEISDSEAARFIQDVLLRDGAPALNLAGFATTSMGSEAEDFMLKNLVSYFAV